MRFSLIDRIVELEPGVRVSAIKALALSEGYLEDHFPKFPVMPGVLMLEALVQAASWLILKSEDFSHSVVTLREARNVKFAEFVRPGEVLAITVEVMKHDASTTMLKAQGVVNGRVAVSARLLMERCNMADRLPNREVWDATTRAKIRKRFELIYQPSRPNLG